MTRDTDSQTAPEPSAEPAADPKEVERALLQRFVATLVGLPGICRFRRCRRTHRCVGGPIACWADHGGLIYSRVDRLLARAARRQRGSQEPP